MRRKRWRTAVVCGLLGRLIRAENNTGGTTEAAWVEAQQITWCNGCKLKDNSDHREQTLSPFLNIPLKELTCDLFTDNNIIMCPILPQINLRAWIYNHWRCQNKSRTEFRKTRRSPELSEFFIWEPRKSLQKHSEVLVQISLMVWDRSTRCPHRVKTKPDEAAFSFFMLHIQYLNNSQKNCRSPTTLFFKIRTKNFSVYHCILFSLTLICLFSSYFEL